MIPPAAPKHAIFIFELTHYRTGSLSNQPSDDDVDLVIDNATTMAGQRQMPFRRIQDSLDEPNYLLVSHELTSNNTRQPFSAVPEAPTIAIKSVVESGDYHLNRDSFGQFVFIPAEGNKILSLR